MRYVILLFLVFVIACTPVATGPQITFDKITFNLEIAQTSEEMQKGLMNRESLPANQGMLFIFTDMQPRGFWMKNTLIPLDMIFLDNNLTVVEVKKNVQPCEADPCPVYNSVPAQYVLEVNAGLAEKNSIGISSVAKLNKQ